MWYPEITSRLKDNSGSTMICDVFSSGRGNSSTGEIKNWDECTVYIPDKVYIDNFAVALGYFITNSAIFFGHMRFPLLNITMGSMIMSSASAFLIPNLTNEIAIVVCFACFITGASVGISTFNILIVEVFPNFLCGMAVSLGLLTGRIATFVATGGLGVMLEKYCEASIYSTGLLMVIAIWTLYSLPKKINMTQ